MRIKAQSTCGACGKVEEFWARPKRVTINWDLYQVFERYERPDGWGRRFDTDTDVLCEACYDAWKKQD